MVVVGDKEDGGSVVTVEEEGADVVELVLR